MWKLGLGLDRVPQSTAGNWLCRVLEPVLICSLSPFQWQANSVGCSPRSGCVTCFALWMIAELLRITSNLIRVMCNCLPNQLSSSLPYPLINYEERVNLWNEMGEDLKKARVQNIQSDVIIYLLLLVHRLAGFFFFK